MKKLSFIGVAALLLACSKNDDRLQEPEYSYGPQPEQSTVAAVPDSLSAEPGPTDDFSQVTDCFSNRNNA